MQNDMSMMVAEKLDRLQKQYVSSNPRLSSLPITSMGFSQVPHIGLAGSLTVHGGEGIKTQLRQTGSATGLNLSGLSNEGP